MGAYPSGEALWRNPITGIAGCCARAASGHVATAPPEQRDEFAPLHSITSSARCWKNIGTSRPSALAVLRFKKQFRFTSPRNGRVPNAL